MNKEKKQEIREEIWGRMKEAGVHAFPFPIQGRIPNFKGAAQAAENLCQTEVFEKATTIKFNPDSPQHPMRSRALKRGKTLLMATPRLRKGFFKITPASVPTGEERRATTIKHMEKYGQQAPKEELAQVDLVITGCVGASPQGARLGKGHGYSDLEYAILRELGLGEVPVATTVHSLQIVEDLPRGDHDVVFDYIATPEKVLETNSPYPRPPGIDWSLLSEEDLEEMPILKEF